MVGRGRSSASAAETFAGVRDASALQTPLFVILEILYGPDSFSRAVALPRRCEISLRFYASYISTLFVRIYLRTYKVSSGGLILAVRAGSASRLASARLSNLSMGAFCRCLLCTVVWKRRTVWLKGVGDFEYLTMPFSPYGSSRRNAYYVV